MITAPEAERRFAPVAHALRDRIIEHYRDRGESLNHDAGLRTLDTNSLLAAGRGAVLLKALERAGHVPDLPSARVADLGCGFGSLSLYFAVLGAEVIGIDPNDERFRVGAAVAAEFGLPVTYRRGWVDDLVWTGPPVDLVVYNNSFCYIVRRRDRRRALENIRSIMVPGGSLVMRNPSRSAIVDPFTSRPLLHQLPPGLTRWLLAGGTPVRSDVRLRTAGGLRRELKRSGFSRARTVRVDQPWWRPPRYQHHVARA